MPCEATGHSPVDKKDPVLLQPLSCPYSQKMIHTSATMRMSCRRKDRSDVCSESAPMHVYAACYQRHGLGSCVRRGMHASKGSRMPNGVFMMPVECEHAQQLVSPRPCPALKDLERCVRLRSCIIAAAEAAMPTECRQRVSYLADIRSHGGERSDV